MTRMNQSILCIDDHEPSLAGWCLYLQNAGYSVETACNGQRGLELFATQAVDLVLLDYAMPVIDGEQVASIMRRIKPDVRIVMLSGVANIPEGVSCHVNVSIQKKERPIVVLQAIERLLDLPQRAA
jgi:CheY-like chemotaxis protein